MHKSINCKPLERLIGSRVFWFSLFWFAGLLAGTVFAVSADIFSCSLMRRAASCQVSIVALLCTVLLPFLFAAYAVTIDRFELLLAVGTFKAFSFAFCTVLAARAFGTAGWLVQPLLQFTDMCMVPVLCWFCIRRISGCVISVKKDLLICLLLTAAVAGFDYFVVSPFLAKLINIQ